MSRKVLFTTLASLLCVILTLSGAPREWSIQTIPNVQKADRTQLVTNPDGVLSSAVTDSLNALLVPLKEQGLAEVAVVAVNSIGDADPVDFRHQLFNHWGLGNEEADNGLLVLLVVEQGAIEIETGYGVEGLLPDALCKRVIENLMIPHFREGDFDSGMLEGVGAMALVLQGADPAEVTEPEEDLVAIAIVALLFGVVPLVAVVLIVRHQSRCPRCKKHTLRRSGRVLLSKTPYQKNYNVTYICTECGKIVNRREVESTAVAAGTMMGGGSHRGGFGGGGFGGGFGGGMSGGGGAGGRF